MIPPKDGWIRFRTPDEKIQYLKKHKLMPSKADTPKPLFYRGAFSDEYLLCDVVGADGIMSVISVNGEIHCIHPDMLEDIQPSKEERTAIISDTAGYPTDAFSMAEPNDHPFSSNGPDVSTADFVEDYTVIDLETTGFGHGAEIIELAAVRVRGGQIADTFQSLVQCRCCLPERITQLTGISPLELAGAPTIENILPAYIDFLGSDIIVGHNVSFDAGFLERACAEVLHHSFENEQIDTLDLSRVALCLPSHKLCHVRDALRLPVRNAHRALSDCLTTYDVYEALKAKPSQPFRDPDSTAKTSDNHRYRAAPLEYHPELYPSVIVEGVRSAFYQKNCVFTGELHISREEAQALIARAGGQVKSAVSRKTHFLIVGQQDIKLVGDDGLSQKEEKALELNRSGKGNIQMIDEDAFIAILSQEVDPPELEKNEDDQLALSGFVPLETQTYLLVEPRIREVIKRNFLDDKSLSFEKCSGYWSVSYYKSLIARIHFGKTVSYCSVDANSARKQLDALGIKYDIKASDAFFARIKLKSPEDILPCLDVIDTVTQHALDAIPKGFDCCGSYMECSNAKQCVQTKDDLRLECGYRRILASGRIFYGENRNID